MMGAQPEEKTYIRIHDSVESSESLEKRSYSGKENG